MSWNDRKREVLAEFTLAGKVSVAASFLLDESEDGGDMMEADGAVPLAKARARLEALEAAARGGASVELTQAELERRVAKLSRDLTRAWAGSQRVTSLKIAIQCAKLLAEARVPMYYPSMFVRVADVLDTFGSCVFERLKGVAEAEQARMGAARGSTLPSDFASGDVGAEAQETARNWVFKLSCIRELLPRLYVEISLLELYRFLHTTADFAPIILRLSHSIRGVGDPLVASHVRWYLARAAARLIHDPSRLRDSLTTAVTDYIYTFPDVIRAATKSAPSLAPSSYLRLHAPAVAWLVAVVGDGAPRETFQAVLQAYKEHCGNGMVLRTILDAFDGAHWSAHLAGVLKLVSEAAPGDAPAGLLRPSATTSDEANTATVAAASTAELFRAMAGALAFSPPPDALRIPFLNEAWRSFTRVGDAATFARHAAALTDLLLAAYSAREVALLLADLVKRITAAAAASNLAGAEAGGVVPLSRGDRGVSAPSAALPHLQRILVAVVSAEAKARATVALGAESEWTRVLGGEHYAQLLDMFSSDARPELCRRILAAFVAAPEGVSNAVVINTCVSVQTSCRGAIPN
jgi:hypothetical protein